MAKSLTTLQTLIEQLKYLCDKLTNEYDRELFIVFVSSFASDLFIRSIKNQKINNYEKLN